MKDPRGKKVKVGTTVAALVGVGAQVIGRVCRISADEILFEADVNLSVQPETPTGAMVLIPEGKSELEREKWNQPKNKRLKIMDQRDNQIAEGVDIVALMPTTVQIVGVVTECNDPHLVAGRGGKMWKIGGIQIKAFIPLPVKNGRAACVVVPPEEKTDDTRDDSGIILVQ